MINLELLKEWQILKETERAAVERRHEIENLLVKQFDISDQLDGTKNIECGDYQVKIVGRMNKKVDAEKLQELAAESGLTDHLSSLFRWKPEINTALFKAANPAITNPLLGAITTTPAKPSFTILTKA